MHHTLWRHHGKKILTVLVLLVPDGAAHDANAQEHASPDDQTRRELRERCLRRVEDQLRRVARIVVATPRKKAKQSE